jgi:hypothetical protein
MNAALIVLVTLLGLSAAMTPLGVRRRSWPLLTGAAILSLACCVVGGFTLALLAGFLPCAQLGLAVALRWRMRWTGALALALPPALVWAAGAFGMAPGWWPGWFFPPILVPVWVVGAAIALALGDPQWRGTASAEA